MGISVRVNQIVNHKAVKLLTEIAIFLPAIYFVIKKVTGFSLTGWLVNKALQQGAVDVFVIFCFFVFILAAILKIIYLYYEQYPINNGLVADTSGISECLVLVNDEVDRHIAGAGGGLSDNIKKITHQHSFSANLAVIVKSLVDHILSCTTINGVKRDDIFVSLYEFDSQGNALKYRLHHDPKKGDLVKSKMIGLDNPVFSGYECVKCFNSEDTVAYVLNQKEYAEGNSKRKKTLKHYIGCKLVSSDRQFGFLNIEFHSHEFFHTDKALEEFMIDNVFPFKSLLEYQYLKREFLNLLVD